MTSTGQAGPPAEVVRLFEALGEEQFVRYPSLTRDELISIGDQPMLHDAEDLAWWDGLDEGTRAQVRATAQRGLLARGLVSLDGSDPAVLDVSSPLRTVLALRRVPAFVTLVGPAAGRSPTLRCYGVLGPDSRTAVLLEARILTGVAEYLLCTPAYAATAVTRFLFAPPDPDDPAAVPAEAELGGRMVLRRLELFPPGELSDGRRFVAVAGVSAGALAPVGSDGRPGPAAQVSEQSVVDLVSAHWAGDTVAAARLVTDGSVA
jgi:hypothetical protein